ncbi:bpX6 domain-containing protein [Roseateles sp. BYS96W]|uniref:BpX6 domain-containing protein n=1 Tax=Pelomonas nitida TaxID=3299027 RepID=A0ABW7G5V7_9BURK
MTEHDSLTAPADVAHPTLSGRRLVAALWWPAAWLPEAARRRQVLAHWAAGATLHRFADGDLQSLPVPRPLDCDRLRAWPLQRTAGALCSAALQPADLAGRPTADVWLAEGGRLRALHLRDADVVDPADWLDADIPLITPLDLSLPEPPRQLVAEARPLHDILGPGVPRAPSPEAQRLMQALQATRPAAGTTPPAPATTPRGWRPGRSSGVMLALLAGAALLALIAGLGSGGGGWGTVLLLGAAGYLLTPAGGKRGSGQAASPGAATAASTAAAPGLRARRPLGRLVPPRWRQWAARLSLTTGLARLLGAQHAAYMRRMLAMFDEGRLDDALRHAVPLGGNGQSLGQSFGRLGPRSDLQLGDGVGARASVDFGPELERHLRTLYRRAAQQLEAAGRLDEAVFVLAELMQLRQEALDLLERHGRAADAAELAFRWDLPAAQIVRLYAVAGDWRRAVLVARRDNAFAAAVDLLQSRWPDAAAQLRSAWAQALTARGCWLEAVQVLWPLAAERGQALAWLDTASAAGGAVAVRALAWRAHGWPDTLPAHEALAEALQTDAGLAAERQALIDELLRLPKPVSPATRRLATLMAGPTLADALSGSAGGRDLAQLRALVELAGDAALSADLPTLKAGALPAPRPLQQAKEAVHCELPPGGLQAVLDAVPLPDGELLLALGESGAVRLDARGRRLAHFAAPAHQLVPADGGGSALALARRDDAWRVSRLDITSGRWTDLGMHRLDAFAHRFDGTGWTVATGRRVDVLDVQSPQLRDVLWRVADLPGPVLQIERDDSKEYWWLGPPTPDAHAQQWIYLHAGRRLLSRLEAPPSTPPALTRGMVAGHGLVDLLLAQPADARARVHLRHVASEGGLQGEGIVLEGAEVKAAAQDWLLMARFDGEHDLLELAHWQTGRLHARWHWPEADAPVARFHDGRWLLTDARGRVAVLDTATGHQQRASA